MLKRIKQFFSDWWHSLFNIYLEDEHTTHVVYSRKPKEVKVPHYDYHFDVLDNPEDYH